MTGTDKAVISMPEQKQRILAFLGESDCPQAVPTIGASVFSDRLHRTPQGVVLAIQGALKQLEAEGKVRKSYRYGGPSGGYALSGTTETDEC